MLHLSPYVLNAVSSVIASGGPTTWNVNANGPAAVALPAASLRARLTEIAPAPTRLRNAGMFSAATGRS